ncbi:MAG: cobalamin B12-binding domain-containing protein [Armatimonadota bacterium]
MSKTIIAGALGNCVHVAGVISFLRTAEQLGYKTHFLGPAVSVEEFVSAIEKYNPDIVGVSYRLTPEAGKRLVEQLKCKLQSTNAISTRKFIFGGTPPGCKAVEKLGIFEKCFDGLESPNEVWQYLKGEIEGKDSKNDEHTPACTQIERLTQKYPYPLLRHHFGLPDIKQTVEGIRKIAQSGVVDIISIAPDQNAQESFFRPEEMDPSLDGAGGVPIRTEEDLLQIYEASRCGNFPLLRIYSGTRDLIRWAELSTRTLNNAWGAIPLCWYSVLDKRSNRTPVQAIKENQECMRWYANRDIPVEVNESHHWAMRDAHDTISVVMSYLAAYNAKQAGVRYYISQYMFNTPPSTSGAMDLAKTLAQLEMVESLQGPDFFTMRQVRAGLLHLTPRTLQAKGQLAASTVLALAIRPHIIHVVGFCEGDHAALPDEVIESCEIVHGVLRNVLSGMPDMSRDPLVLERKEQLISEANVLISAIRETAVTHTDPLTDPKTLANAIASGLLDAPQLKGNPYALGAIETHVVNGAVLAIDHVTKTPISEKERIRTLLKPPLRINAGSNDDTK